MVSEKEVVRLYRCVFCGRAFTSLKALHGHLKKHRGVRRVRTSFEVPAEKWERFKEKVRRHKSTTCAVLNSLIDWYLAQPDEYLGYLHSLEQVTENPSFMGPVWQFIYVYGGDRPRSRLKYLGLLRGDEENVVSQESKRAESSWRERFERRWRDWLCPKCGCEIESCASLLEPPPCPSCGRKMFPKGWLDR